MSSVFRFLNAAAREEFFHIHLIMGSSSRDISYALAKRLRDREPMVIERIGVNIQAPVAIFGGVLEWFEIPSEGMPVLHFVGGQTLHLSVLTP